MPSLLNKINEAIAKLAEAGVDNPALDARLLVAHALGCDRLDLVTNGDKVLSPSEMDKIERLINRRAAREPVARIIGLREFWGLPFEMNEATLEPRPDSETIVEAALKIVLERSKAPNPHILDLGTGTGCLLLALLHEVPKATGVGLDISPRATEQAATNAVRIGLNERAKFIAANWNDDLEKILNEKFDLVVSNPPYIESATIKTLQPEVKDHDPLAALDGGNDGLEAYRAIIPQLPRLLAPNGAAIFELGLGQAEYVRTMLGESGFSETSCFYDYNGIKRCVSACNTSGPMK